MRAFLLDQLLKLILRIEIGAIALHIGRAIQKPAIENRFRRVHTSVEVRGSDNRLEGVRQNRFSVPTTSSLLGQRKLNPLPQIYRPGGLGQGLASNERGSQLCEIALPEIRETLEEASGHDHPQNRVSQKLHALVRRRSARVSTVGVRTVPERLGQKRSIGEAMAQRLLELR